MPFIADETVTIDSVLDANWQVLTHSAAVAKKLELIPGATSASGRCPLATGDEPAYAVP